MNLKSIIKKGLLPLALAASIAIPPTSNIVYADELIAEENVVEENIVDVDVSGEDIVDETIFDDNAFKKDELEEEINEDEQEYEETIVESEVEVVETNTVDICSIIVGYTKEIEIYDGFIPTGETTTMPLYTTIELEYGSSLSSVDMNAMNSDVALILGNVSELKGEIKSGYIIKANIDLQGNVSIASVEAQSLKQDSTDVTVYKSIATREKIEKENVSAKDKKDSKEKDADKTDENTTDIDKTDVDKMADDVAPVNEEAESVEASDDFSTESFPVCDDKTDDNTTTDEDEPITDASSEEKSREEEE